MQEKEKDVEVTEIPFDPQLVYLLGKGGYNLDGDFDDPRRTQYRPTRAVRVAKRKAQKLARRHNR